jgi:hypothetical protein
MAILAILAILYSPFVFLAIALIRDRSMWRE